MALKTTAFERAEALGWTLAELASRSGLSIETLYKLKSGDRGAGPKAVEGLLAAFPNLSYRDLFVPSNRTTVQRKRMAVQREEAVA